VVSGERGAIDLYWITSRVSGSPIRLHIGDVDLVPIGILEAGVFAGHGRPASSGGLGSAPLPGRNDATAWLALGAGGRLEIPLSAHWVTEIEGDGLFPLLRPEAGFANQPAMFEPPPVAASVALGARYVFP
jgi:hypothetical protein